MKATKSKVVASFTQESFSRHVPGERHAKLVSGQTFHYYNPATEIRFTASIVWDDKLLKTDEFLENSKGDVKQKIHKSAPVKVPAIHRLDFSVGHQGINNIQDTIADVFEEVLLWLEHSGNSKREPDMFDVINGAFIP